MLSLSTSCAARALRSPPRVRNLIAKSEDVSAWPSVSASVSGPLGLNAMGRFSGFAIASDGQDWHRVNCFNETIDGSQTYWISIWLQAGSSDALRVEMRDKTAAVSYVYSGALSDLPAAQSVFTFERDELMPDGVTRRVVLCADFPFSGDGSLGVGPYSDQLGEDIVILAVQVETGTNPTAYQPRL